MYGPLLGRERAARARHARLQRGRARGHAADRVVALVEETRKREQARAHALDELEFFLGLELVRVAAVVEARELEHDVRAARGRAAARGHALPDTTDPGSNIARQ